MAMNPHESAFVAAFVIKARRERALELLANPKNRQTFTSRFDHHAQSYIVPECIQPIEPRHQNPADILALLQRMGAPRTCHFIGGLRDGEDVELGVVLGEVVGCGVGTVLSCVPGVLAYFEGELKERFLLVRR